MNFITKNLGWILLLVFFIFMLFIISSNGTQKGTLTDSGTLVSSSTLSGETDQNLDDLIKKIDNQELVVQEEESQELIEELVTDIEDSEIISEERLISSEVTVEEEKGFFARLFGSDDNQEEKDEEEQTGEGNETTQSGAISEKTENNEEDFTIVEKVENVDKDVAYIKNTSRNSKDIYVDPAIVYPGVNLETEIGKSYEIGVETLRLNNKGFNTTLAYLHQGEVVTQLTSENEYGCFQVEVSSTSQKGYVCKKYLESSSDIAVTAGNDSKQEVIALTPTETAGEETVRIPAISTSIGSYYKVALDNTSFFDVVLERFTLDKGDILKQVSDPDAATGCVNMKVVGSVTGDNDGEVVGICSPDMVVAM